MRGSQADRMLTMQAREVRYLKQAYLRDHPEAKKMTARALDRIARDEYKEIKDERDASFHQREIARKNIVDMVVKRANLNIYVWTLYNANPASGRIEYLLRIAEVLQYYDEMPYNSVCIL